MEEIHLGLATLFRQYDLDLFETDVSDVRLAHDFFPPSARLDSKGIRVTARGVARKEPGEVAEVERGTWA
ncbi:uncharacterized protein PV07_00390 [Cladophialophora immunda]|uniref:Uncharacterized protein n=1 Tax=Cladophialophora immunda TaxID=569365 RepID=A0A0D2CUM1_9EURO|nr:uncharacterized protein PV07_00390 [Cladophialophora immunda]KIW33550.1 hypothetical protein PV07_00390 [Cladophialophora immunda]